MNRSASASDRGWQNSAVHREVDNRHAFWVFKVVVSVAVALVPLAVYLLQTMSYVETSYAIEHLRASEARLTDAERRLTIEKAVLESLPAVEQRAGVELKLEHPAASRVIVVSPTELGRPAASGAASRRPPSR
jgi:cell division protein FtsL